MTSNEYFKAASKNSNVALALTNFQMWLGWHPSDYAGATEFAGDVLETVPEVDEFERCVQAGLELKALEVVTESDSIQCRHKMN